MVTGQVGVSGAAARATKDALQFLSAKLQPAPPPDRARIERWLVDLCDKRFAVRDAAMRELEKLGEVAETALHKALAGTASLETKRRLEQLVDRVRRFPVRDPEILRVIRAVQCLEYVGSQRALEHLQQVARSAPEARLTQEAKAAVSRLPRP